MKLGFDVDGIIADMATAMIEHMNEKYHLNHTISVFHNHALGLNKYVEDEKLNKEIVNSIQENVIRNDEALINLKPYDDAIRHLHILKKNGHVLFFVTSRSKDNEGATIEWFRKNKIPFDGLYVVGQPGVVGQLSKGPFGRALNLDFFIDDDVPNLEEMYRFKNRWFKGLALFSRPWNDWLLLDSDKFIRLNDWPDILRHMGISSRATKTYTI
jgi:uncharacterized protein